MSILGLVPLWFAGEFAGSPMAKGFVYLRHACGLKTGKEPMQHLIKAIRREVMKEVREYCSYRDGENIVCKTVRTKLDSDKRFRDLVLFGQHIYVAEGDKVRVYYQNGKEVLLEGPMIKFWPYCDDMLPSSDLVEKLRVKLSVGVFSFRMPSELIWTGRIALSDNYHKVV